MCVVYPLRHKNGNVKESPDFGADDTRTSSHSVSIFVPVVGYCQYTDLTALIVRCEYGDLRGRA